MYERLTRLMTLHHWDNGWWCGVDHELWLLREQRRLYGQAASLPDDVQQAVRIMLAETGQSPADWQDLLGPVGTI